MTPLTRCNLRKSSLALLRPRALLRVFFLFVLLGSLALAQTHLRFRTRDMQIETRKLQKERAELQNRRTMLVSEVESLKRCDEQFRRYAREELGLEESAPGFGQSVTVASDTVSRWRSVRRTLDLPRAPIVREERVLADVGRRMLAWSTPLMARDASAQDK